MERRLENMKKGLAAVRRLLDPPLQADAPPIEIRAAILDAIEQQVAVVGIGDRVFPHGAVSVRVLVPDAPARALFDRVFADFEGRVRERFAEMRCAVPEGFSARVVAVRAAPAAWTDGQRFAVEFVKRQETAPVVAARTAARIPVLVITVVSGAATKPAFRLRTPVVHIGRTDRVHDTRGRVRRNHVAFDEQSPGISRAHARIDYDSLRGEYRVVDEGSAKGTRLVRGDTTIDVRPRRQDARGVRLEAGDEIHLPGAAIRISFE